MDTKKDKWVCEKCGATNDGWILDVGLYLKNKHRVFKKAPCENCLRIKAKEDKEIEEAIRKRKLAQKVKELFIASEIPPKIINEFKNLEIKKGAELAFSVLQKIEKADRWIYIHGDNNTGKSCLIGAAIKRLSELGIPSFYFNERSLFVRLKNNNFKNKEKDIVFNAIKKAKVVFCDDFSVFKWSDWEKSLIFDIINELDYRNTIFVITSNMNYFQWLKNDKEYLEDRIGKRLIARLKRNNIYEIEMKNNPFFT